MNETMKPPLKSKLLPFAPYYVSKSGEVFSMLSGKVLKWQINNVGYAQVWLKCKDGSSKWFKIHRLVALLFRPNLQPSKLIEVGHKDNNKLNNYYINLYWCTHSQNILDSYNTGRAPSKGNKGKKHSNTAKQLMSKAKQGTKHPMFKGYYIYNGVEYTSLNSLAVCIGTYPIKVKRMFDKGLIGFRGVS